MSTVRMDVINTLVQENRAFAEELEEQIIRGQQVENMLVNAQKVMTENTLEIKDLKRKLYLKNDNLPQAEMEISMIKRTHDGSTQDNMSVGTLGSLANDLKRQVSLQCSEGDKDKDRARDAQLDTLQQEIRSLRDKNQSLQTLFVNSENGNKLLKESFSQTGIIRLQGELQDLQRLQLNDIVPDSLSSGLKFSKEIQPIPEDSFLWLQQPGRHESVYSSISTTTSQCRVEKQLLSGATTPEDCLSIRSFSPRVSEHRLTDPQTSPKTVAPGRDYNTLQKHLSEAQELIMEMDMCIQDSFKSRLQEDSLTRAVIESLMQQNRAIGQELEVQMTRVHEMEVMLTEAYEQKAAAVSKSQTAMDELQDFIRGRDKLLKELSEDYSLLREEKGRLQSFFCDDVQENAALNKSFNQSQPQINKMQGELLDHQRQQRSSCQSKLHYEERESGQEDSASVTRDLKEFGTFLGGTQSETVASEGPAHINMEYKTQHFKV